MSILYSEIYKIAISVRGEEMYKVTEMNNDEIMWQLIRSELGFILLGEDGADAFSVLAKKWNMERQTTYKWQQISDNVLLFPILYKQDPQPHDFSDLIETRAIAIKTVFARWTAAGYNTRHAKSPFNSKAFSKYLDDIGYREADYLLLLVTGS